MRTREIVLIHAAIVLPVVLAAVPLTSFAAAQFGRLGDATRWAADAVKTAADSKGQRDGAIRNGSPFAFRDKEFCRGAALFSPALGLRIKSCL